MTSFNFDATTVDPDQGRLGPIPAGIYSVLIKEAVLEPNSQGTGQIIKAQLAVIDGEYKDRVVYTNFNVMNQSEKAQEIGQKQFSALLHAIDVLQIADTAEIVNKPLKIRVKIKAADGEYEARNEVTAYRNINDNSLVETGGTAANGAKPGTNSVAPPKTAVAAPPPRPPAPMTAPGQLPANPPAQPWMADAAPTAPTPPVPTPPAPAPVAPAPVAAPVAPAPVAAPVSDWPAGYTPTEKAGVLTFASFVAQNWTIGQLVEHGYATAPVVAQAAPTPPAPSVAAPVGGEPPPWEAGDAQS